MMRVLFVCVVYLVSVECGWFHAWSYAPGDGEYDWVTGDCCEPFSTRDAHELEIAQAICTYNLGSYCDDDESWFWCNIMFYTKHKCCPYKQEDGELCRCRDEESQCHYTTLWRNLMSLKGICEYNDVCVRGSSGIPPP